MVVTRFWHSHAILMLRKASEVESIVFSTLFSQEAYMVQIFAGMHPAKQYYEVECLYFVKIPMESLRTIDIYF